MVVGKIVCITGVDSHLMVSLKVMDEEFEEFTAKEEIAPSPHLARYKWTLVKESSAVNKKQLGHCISQSFESVKSINSLENN